MVTLSFILWFSVFSGTYTFGGVSIYPPLLISIFGYLIIGLKPKIKNRLFSSLFVKITLLMTLLLIILVCVSSLVNNSESVVVFVMFRYILKSILIPLGCSFVILHYINNLGLKKFYYSIITMLFLQLSLTTMQITIPEVRHFLLSIIHLEENWLALANIGHFRATGLAGISIYDTSIAYSFFLLLLIGLSNSSSFKDKALCSFGIFSCLMLSAISGRTGLIFSLATLVLLLAISKNRRTYSFLLFMFIGGGIFIALVYFGLDDFLFYTKFMLEPLFMIIFPDTESASLNQLQDEYLFIPWHSNLYIGDGVWAQPSISRTLDYEYSTDSGFILAFLSVGILGLVYSFLILHLYSVTVYLHIKQLSNYFFAYVAYSVFFILLAFSMLKGPIYFSERLFPVVLMVVICNEIRRKKQVVNPYRFV
ncbi:hypothetical protein [Colwellia echini]|uniref:O-antigen polymerase n=1 Tax=Colwellia echini TaxID=1982103 RepID=A0ABY3MU55_9GAMM|nr:hypothetical protein [Colwellia echini]TYK64720.1 hypothetical protein CWS31_014190 [Colwellia echini]